MTEDVELRWMYAAIRDATPVVLAPTSVERPKDEDTDADKVKGLQLTVPVEWTVKWPSIPKCDVLMVRHFYDRFIEQHVWCVLPKKEGAAARPENQLVITGTPGIGKSAFGMYLLHRALNVGKTAVFVRNAQSEGIPFITVFHGGAVWKASSVGGALGGLIDDPEVV
ncbi:MAG: hypothetical protein EOO65_05645, partial [Methanosarcinales archaeon]